ncbi:MAG: DUF4215 domain-containing protein [Candidatus Peregrinibacteria bacterium]|nr:DUF4215 domain-containing protein [Candidatus Peregrinibacteria bacterium]
MTRTQSLSLVLGGSCMAVVITLSATGRLDGVFAAQAQNSPAQLCGNGVLNLRAAEQCDDGNTSDKDGCSNKCKVEPGYTCEQQDGRGDQRSICTETCGNGVPQRIAGEQCDDGNRAKGDGCSPQCKVPFGWRCVNPGVDPNTDSVLGPRSLCTKMCGNGTVDVHIGEQCDIAIASMAEGCNQNCKTKPGYICEGNACTLLCGNGKLDVDAAEECDDGNLQAGDGCAPVCRVQRGFICDQPNNGDTQQPSVCTALCGNGIVEEGSPEQCDDQNAVNGDGCARCKTEFGYYCDNGFGHPSQCSLLCGNGVLEREANEECDDGNRVNGDGCSAKCKPEKKRSSSSSSTSSSQGNDAFQNCPNNASCTKGFFDNKCHEFVVDCDDGHGGFTGPVQTGNACGNTACAGSCVRCAGGGSSSSN